mmetsp:Transcript_48391/g.121830  ORF Transcript_48391/g.121830 Transcript_48391/m.121830 type:complete len:90 (-) Transcript_48391:158-427(-)
MFTHLEFTHLEAGVVAFRTVPPQEFLHPWCHSLNMEWFINLLDTTHTLFLRSSIFRGAINTPEITTEDSEGQMHIITEEGSMGVVGMIT